MPLLLEFKLLLKISYPGMLNSLSTALHLLLCLTSVNAMTFGLEVVLFNKVFNSCNLFVRQLTLVYIIMNLFLIAELTSEPFTAELLYLIL